MNHRTMSNKNTIVDFFLFNLLAEMHPRSTSVNRMARGQNQKERINMWTGCVREGRPALLTISIQ
jgi:hypothetical protein